MNKQGMTRRDFFRWTATTGAATVAAGVLLSQNACGGKGGEEGLSCADDGGLTLADKQTRTVNKYIDKSVTKGKSCSNCQLFQAPKAANTCGTCTVVKGTINPDGHCLLWAEKKA